MPVSHYDVSIEPILEVIPKYKRASTSGCGNKTLGVLKREGDCLIISIGGN